jgi:hypothetical protein
VLQHLASSWGPLIVVPEPIVPTEQNCNVTWKTILIVKEGICNSLQWFNIEITSDHVKNMWFFLWRDIIVKSTKRKELAHLNPTLVAPLMFQLTWIWHEPGHVISRCLCLSECLLEIIIYVFFMATESEHRFLGSGKKPPSLSRFLCPGELEWWELQLNPSGIPSKLAPIVLHHWSGFNLELFSP